jgi:hypothetical protein
VYTIVGEIGKVGGTDGRGIVSVRVAVDAPDAVAMVVGSIGFAGDVFVANAVGVLEAKTIGARVAVSARETGDSLGGASGAINKFTNAIAPSIKSDVTTKIIARTDCSLARSCSNENKVVRESRRASTNNFAPSRMPTTHNR